MCRHLDTRVIRLLRTYLRLGIFCGLVVFGYSKKNYAFRVTKWRRAIGLLFGLFYLANGAFVLRILLSPPYNYDFLPFGISAIPVYINLAYLVLFQLHKAQQIVAVLNLFYSNLDLVFSVTYLRIEFPKMLALRSTLRFIPSIVFCLGAMYVFLGRSKPLALNVVVGKFVPEVLVEMLHHSVYMGLYIVAKMYEHLNRTLRHRRMEKSRKLTDVYLTLFRLSRELNTLLAEYLFLHLFLNLTMISALLVITFLQWKFSPGIFYVTISTLNRLRALMTITEEISEASKFYQKNGVYEIEFYFMASEFQICWSYRMDRKLFFKVLGVLIFHLLVVNRYFYLTNRKVY